MSLTIDFLADWTSQIARDLTNLGYSVDPADSPRDLGVKYFNVLKRRVPTRPRKVHVASLFACPADQQAGCDQLREKFERGDDVNPHLSTALLRADYSDGLLNDWGIHHFHLGLVPHPTRPGFVHRTGPLLYARVDDDDVYFIAVDAHGKWTDQQLLEVIADNWPNILSRYVAAGDNAAPITNDDVKNLRGAHMNTALQINGTTYLPAGGGLAGSGESADAVFRATKSISELRRLERHVNANADRILHRLGKTAADSVVLRFHVDAGAAVAVDPATGIAFNLGRMEEMAG